MKNKIIIGIILCSVIFIIWISNEIKTGKVLEEKPFTIGFSIDTMIVERWKKDKDIMLSKAKERGIEVITMNANEDNDRQVEQLTKLVEANVDVIIVIPFDKDGISNILKKAKSKGIKIISYDRLVMGAPVDAYISFDNILTGKLMAEQLIEKVPEGNYMIINGSSKDNNSYMLNKGYYEIINKTENSKNINVVQEVWAENWRETVAYEAVIKSLEDDYKIDAIIASNDRLAEEAIRALAEFGMVNSVKVVGQDADINACKQIIDDVQLATVYKPISELVDLTLDVALALREDIVLDGFKEIDNDFEIVKYYTIKPMLVNKDNMMDTVIADGFHKEEDIYK